MAKVRVSVSVDPDLDEKFGKLNYSEILNNALRAMASTDINVPYYAQREKDCLSRLANINTSIEKVDELLNPALKVVEKYGERKTALMEQKELIEMELAENRKHLNEYEDSERKLQLTFEINNVIRKCNYNIDEIKSIIGDQLKEMKELVPSFDLEKQIEIVRDWS